MPTAALKRWMESEGKGRKSGEWKSGVRVLLKDESGQWRTGQSGDQAGGARAGPKSGEG